MTNQQFWSWVQLGRLSQADVVPKESGCCVTAGASCAPGMKCDCEVNFGVENGDRPFAHGRSFRVQP